MPIIEVKDLVKEFTSIKKKKGLRGAIENLFKAEKTRFNAVDNISFSIDKGEMVGYLGPNGAGKSTTIKMMSGILHPTSGSVRIDGISPHTDRKAVARKIGVVFGQRTQLYWDLRLGESFELIKRIYQIEDRKFKENMKLMDDILQINQIIDTPVRQLSLGQRMRGDLVASILHSPEVLFLDEPTIGLDVDGKHAVRQFIKDINANLGTTLILTTHDLDDIEQLCSRLIIINHGRIIEEGPLNTIVDKIARYRILQIDLNTDCDTEQLIPQSEFVHIHKKQGLRIWIRFDKSKYTASSLISEMLQKLDIKDLSVIEPDIEEVIREVYKK